MSKNIPASVRQRLRDLAGRRNEEFGLVLTKYALERVLFRLGRSKHRESFVLKGALPFELWTKERHRPTRDVDFSLTDRMILHGSSASSTKFAPMSSKKTA